MRVNVYAEEMTDRIEIIGKEIDGHTFTGLRFYLELPATVNGVQHQAPFMHRPGDDDSAAVTFWGKRDLREVLRKALAMLDEHYDGAPPPASRATTALHDGDTLLQLACDMSIGQCSWVTEFPGTASCIFANKPLSHRCPYCRARLLVESMKSAPTATENEHAR